MSCSGAQPAGALDGTWLDRVKDSARHLDDGQWTSWRFPMESGLIEQGLSGLGTVFPTGNALSCWIPGDGDRGVALGWGSAFELVADGADRFESVRAQATELYARYRTADEAMQAPRCFGGFAFSPGGAAAGSWRRHGDAHFIVPRLLYEDDGINANLSLTLSVAEATNPTILAEQLGQMAAVRHWLSEGKRSPVAAHQALTLHEEGLEDWTNRLLSIAGAISRGELAKVVAARELKLQAQDDFHIGSVLRALVASHGDGTIFDFAFGAGHFLGASPERLVCLRGLEVATEALAGSAVGSDPSGELAEVKNLSEHAMVVRTITEALSPLCGSLHVPVAPIVRRLRSLAHLHTPITGKLKGRTHILKLVEALHPTPAVCGVPTASAADWIRRTESFERGWYSGPVGWFDALGDGVFVVGLRSGLLEGRQASLFAGAGIVQGSTPEREFLETRWKLGTLLGALGVQ
jgi:isochorismate synthase